ncbi:hypothetical protein CIHG_08335 [Coccidioides immitis H538.4]|uniref:Uncharacterized protein n=2 Tax=Coccidioides immitis TaxID=5501 RepID=A0A0J8S0X2_COCIT|nr:hypothetical protein CIRG_06389 [Coccidioides immitis RMSCC 2394]KMU90446.1 hypothetical protein CIHG_08335 [Coccidioides immitis H538.4]
MDIVVGLATITTDSRVIAGTEIIVRVHQSGHTTRPAARPHSKSQNREHRKFLRNVRSSCHRCFDHHTQPHTQAQEKEEIFSSSSHASKKKTTVKLSDALDIFEKGALVLPGTPRCYHQMVGTQLDPQSIITLASTRHGEPAPPSTVIPDSTPLGKQGLRTPPTSVGSAQLRVADDTVRI